ncbi:MAG TPA: hypothetical protein VFD80_02315, partial [Flavobacteriaceae bacterium]|nr:hypothetical protein [Flavobacteriaceae bacterium]
IELLHDRDNDLEDITRVILRMLSSLGMEPEDLKDDPNATDKERRKAKRKKQKKIINSLGGVVQSMMFDPSAVEKRFSFIGDFKPLLDKHQNLITKIQNENE